MRLVLASLLLGVLSVLGCGRTGEVVDGGAGGSSAGGSSAGGSAAGGSSAGGSSAGGSSAGGSSAGGSSAGGSAAGGSAVGGSSAGGSAGGASGGSGGGSAGGPAFTFTSSGALDLTALAGAARHTRSELDGGDRVFILSQLTFVVSDAPAGVDCSTIGFPTVGAHRVRLEALDSEFNPLFASTFTFGAPFGLVAHGNGYDGRWSMHMESGSLTVSSLTATRVSGSFSGTARNVDGGTMPWMGTFDFPLCP